MLKAVSQSRYSFAVERRGGHILAHVGLDGLLLQLGVVYRLVIGQFARLEILSVDVGEVAHEVVGIVIMLGNVDGTVEHAVGVVVGALVVLEIEEVQDEVSWPAFSRTSVGVELAFTEAQPGHSGSM